MRDRTDARIPPAAFVLFLAAIVAAQNLLPAGAALPAQGILVATGLAVWASRRAWRIPAAERYARVAD
ncbi:MAG: hypothetical protein FIB06_01480 [Betaproteobacteria bacterium]|nr:hypothetical protein [Betaproteobacteria bacterium]